jgi:hypothetical protein
MKNSSRRAKRAVAKQWCSVKRCPHDWAIARRDGHQQPGEVFDVSHMARYLAGAPEFTR